ncbi:MAG: hypothetical protein P4L84_10485 [Isosphaeraceae bacterium]|nr:hypothetical protein [Isosphaeraceae bacterium]
MRYQKRLDDNLMPPPKRDQGKYEELMIFIRPPKNMVPSSSKEFLLYPAIEPGKFDLEGSFIEDKKQTPSLHILARIKKPKDTSKKKVATPADTATRGDFNTDVLAIVNAVYSSDVDLAKFKEVTEKRNKYKHHTLEVNDKNVQVYLYGGKDDSHQVALIFEYPKAEQQTLVGKIKLSLESFTVGRRAQANYAGAVGEEAESAGAGQGVAF